MELVSALYCSVPLSNRKSLLLAVGTVEGRVVVCTPLESDCEVLELQGVCDSSAQTLISRYEQLETDCVYTSWFLVQ